eukprot:8143911-Alexandrium_andersonii.AAC.1
MSASLVGSEMCIRDSLAGLLSAGSNHADSSRAGPSLAGLVAAELSFAGCLLYTSDAADDM